MPIDLDAIMRYVVDNEGSDLHLKVGAYPLARIHGQLVPVPDTDLIRPEDTQRAVDVLKQSGAQYGELQHVGEVDFSNELKDGAARFRISAYKQRGVISLAFRIVPTIIQGIEDLDLPPVIKDMTEEERGIVLITGSTGSGKSTTLAAMVHHINTSQAKHIITIEDPIEFVHSDNMSIVDQREVGHGHDTASFETGLIRSLRQDPDIILVGEMRDSAAVSTAMDAAETGHLVMSTMHTVNASEAINRIIGFYPPHQHGQVRSMLAGTLQGIVSQRLARTVDGKRVAVCEILRMTKYVRDLILDPDGTAKLPVAIASGSDIGMQTFDQAITTMVEDGRVSPEEARRVATDPRDMILTH